MGKIGVGRGKELKITEEEYDPFAVTITVLPFSMPTAGWARFPEVLLTETCRDCEKIFVNLLPFLSSNK